jgi:hypothetical protein
MRIVIITIQNLKECGSVPVKLRAAKCEKGRLRGPVLGVNRPHTPARAYLLVLAGRTRTLRTRLLAVVALDVLAVLTARLLLLLVTASLVARTL